MVTTFSSVHEDACGCHSIFRKIQSQGKVAAAKKSCPSEDSDEEQKMDMDEENSNVARLEEVKPRKKLVERVMGDAEEGDINGKTSSILKTTKGDAGARVKKKVDEGIKVVKSNEEQQPEEEETITEIESRIIQGTQLNEENQNHSSRAQLRFQRSTSR